MSLSFGVFPLGLAGSPDGLASGPPDDWDAIARAMTGLQGGGPPVMPRIYVNWAGPASTPAALAQVEAYAAHALPWDLVLCYRDPGGDTQAWASFAARVVAEYGSRLAAVQVTAEANLAGIPAAADGAFPGAREALVRGLLRAAEAKRAARATASTSPGRPEKTQARVLETVVRTVSDLGAELNVTHWELFALRDADSSGEGLFYHFGVLRDDYSAKPAFGVLRNLIAELSPRTSA